MSLSPREKALFMQVARGRAIMAPDPMTGW
jgi:hypothetical protein